MSRYGERPEIGRRPRFLERGWLDREPCSSLALRFSARRRIFDPHKNQVPIDKAAETMLESLLKGGTCMIAKVKLHYEPDVRKIPATDVNKEESFLIIRNGEKIVGRFPLSQIEHWSLDQDPDAR